MRIFCPAMVVGRPLLPAAACLALSRAWSVRAGSVARTERDPVRPPRRAWPRTIVRGGPGPRGRACRAPGADWYPYHFVSRGLTSLPPALGRCSDLLPEAAHARADRHLVNRCRSAPVSNPSSLPHRDAATQIGVVTC